MKIKIDDILLKVHIIHNKMNELKKENEILNQKYSDLKEINHQLEENTNKIKEENTKLKLAQSLSGNSENSSGNISLRLMSWLGKLIIALSY